MSNAYVGEWLAESITQDGMTTLVPSAANARAAFSAFSAFSVEGRIRLFDTVNTIGGVVSAVKGGFSVRDASTTLAYYGGPDPVRLLVVAAFRAMVVAGRVAASVRDDRLAVAVGEFRIVFTRAN